MGASVEWVDGAHCQVMWQTPEAASEDLGLESSGATVEGDFVWRICDEFGNGVAIDITAGDAEDLIETLQGSLESWQKWKQSQGSGG